jgi:hypothetical protein
MLKLRYYFVFIVLFLQACASQPTPNSAISGCDTDDSKDSIECRVMAHVRPVATAQALENHITLALNRNALEHAKAHVALAKRLSIALDHQLYDSYLTELDQSRNPPTLTSSRQEIVGLIGKIIKGDEVNSVDFGLSVMKFMVKTSSYFLPENLVKPTQISIAVLQQGIQNKSISSNFYGVINQSFSEAINRAGIKQAWKNSSLADKLANPLKTLLADNLQFDRLSDLFLTIYKMEQSTSLENTVFMFKYINGLDSFNKTEKLTAVFKDSTPAVLDFIGTDVFTLL